MYFFDNRIFFLWVAEIWPGLNDSICLIWKHLSDLDHLLLFLAVSPAAVNTKEETDSFKEFWIICACACACAFFTENPQESEKLK